MDLLKNNGQWLQVNQTIFFNIFDYKLAQPNSVQNTIFVQVFFLSYCCTYYSQTSGMQSTMASVVSTI